MNHPELANRTIAGATDARIYLPELKGASVVIVDDQEPARSMLAELIRGIDPGVSVHAFGLAGEALHWLERNSPDLIITAYRMPGTTGAQFTSALRNDRHPHVPVIVISAADEQAIRYEALEAGAVDFLTKPIDPVEVRTRCRNLLLLAHQYRLVQSFLLLQDRQLSRLHALFRSHVANAI